MKRFKSILYECFYPIIATINWFKKLFYIIKHYDEDKIEIFDKIQSANLRIRDGVQLIKDRTNIHADVHARLNSPTQVIAIGRYNGRDYVQVFSIHNNDFKGLIHQLKDMEQYGNLRRVDAPIEFLGVLDQDLNW